MFYIGTTFDTINSKKKSDATLNKKKSQTQIRKEKEEEEDELQIYEYIDLFNGDTFDGGWRLGRRHGKGVYVFASGSKYEGEWKEGEMTGWGVYITEDGIRRNIRHK